MWNKRSKGVVSTYFIFVLVIYPIIAAIAEKVLPFDTMPAAVKIIVLIFLFVVAVVISCKISDLFKNK